MKKWGIRDVSMVYLLLRARGTDPKVLNGYVHVHIGSRARPQTGDGSQHRARHLPPRLRVIPPQRHTHRHRRRQRSRYILPQGPRVPHDLRPLLLPQQIPIEFPEIHLRRLPFKLSQLKCELNRVADGQSGYDCPNPHGASEEVAENQNRDLYAPTD